MGETKKAGGRVFLGGGLCLIGEVKKSGELDFLVGDSSLIGADTRKDNRFQIKGTDPELDAVVDAVVASDVGIARSSLIGEDRYSLEGDLMLTTGANDFFI